MKQNNQGEQTLKKPIERPTLTEIAQVEAAVIKGARNYFDKMNYTELVTPHLTRATGSCENVATMFEVDFFGERAYLAQTGQLYLESLIPDLGKVATIGSSFRAEPSVDDRHLTEFTLAEIEFPIAVPGRMGELLSEVENLVRSMIKSGIDKSEDLWPGAKDFSIDQGLLKSYARVTYDEAVDMLSDYGVKFHDDLKAEHEAYIVKEMGRPTFITHYPVSIKFFNMRRNEADSRVVNSADLILPYSGEAVGAAEREFEYDNLVERLQNSPMLRQLEEKGGSIEDFRWYLNEVKERGVPHAGCGVGVNRVTQSILGVKDIRKTTPYAQNKETLL